MTAHASGLEQKSKLACVECRRLATRVLKHGTCPLTTATGRRPSVSACLLFLGRTLGEPHSDGTLYCAGDMKLAVCSPCLRTNATCVYPLKRKTRRTRSDRNGSERQQPDCKSSRVRISSSCLTAVDPRVQGDVLAVDGLAGRDALLGSHEGVICQGNSSACTYDYSGIHLNPYHSPMADLSGFWDDLWTPPANLSQGASPGVSQGEHLSLNVSTGTSDRAPEHHCDSSGGHQDTTGLAFGNTSFSSEARDGQEYNFFAARHNGKETRDHALAHSLGVAPLLVNELCVGLAFH